MNNWFDVGKFALTLVFVSGAQWALFRFELIRLRKDLNGVGDRVRQNESKLFFYVMLTCPEKLDDARLKVLENLTRRHN